MNDHCIGKFCSVAKKDTIIIPKNIPGYTAPEGQVLTEDGQQFDFIYTPINYKINYNLNGGEFNQSKKEYYTIEDDDYVPPIPVKKDYEFIGWEPEKIPHGSIEDFYFTAKWRPNAVLLPGPDLNKALIKLAGEAGSIMAIQHSTNLSEGDYVNISSTASPIFAKFDSGIVYIYCDIPIYCNLNMAEAFSKFTILRDISALNGWICKEGTNINSIFKDCSLLSDVSPVEYWGNGNFKDFTDAFTGTSALESGRVPSWYKWNVTINYMSSTGVVFERIAENRIPGEVVYAKAFIGYKPITVSVAITDPSIEYTFVYEPISYNISYETRGGEILNQKTSYTIEDETYYPPEPIKDGFKFAGWSPECISHGEYGNVTFIANYVK